VGPAATAQEGAPAYLAAPDQAREAPTAQLVGPTDDDTTRARPTVILDQGGEKVDMHRRLLLWSKLRQVGGNSLLYIAGCAAVSGRGYYVRGLAPDVPGRPR
jgi:hypothetical protein